MAKPPKPKTRLELCRELLDIQLANRTVFDRIDAIKTELKARALVEGKFRETFVGLGYVAVSPAAPEQVTGEAPALVIVSWQGLPQSRRDKLLEQGLVEIKPTIKGAYHGRAEVKLFAPPA
ncbi:hypothetical protein IVB45_17605 [Bradyrhizobium sp. 4]|uniref:hypothetical protein n=1 Tax=unclassified Bradyrhizobium TaxID=2631580 RepID=UPI001FF887A1|nr:MULTISPECIES: hypothetical protein [unclassified Bradyrhizobium]MCK1402008.1 hypothetical protein [Bradyrhizobium sp. 39]MCK1751272.1 hypothetical protein [Bradyrhizobium sp. 135]UPJ38523.1 hypothetical protein IVB45_17605 [Bradyrhizobium sp. 4]